MQNKLDKPIGEIDPLKEYLKKKKARSFELYIISSKVSCSIY